MEPVNLRDAHDALGHENYFQAHSVRFSPVQETTAVKRGALLCIGI